MTPNTHLLVFCFSDQCKFCQEFPSSYVTVRQSVSEVLQLDGNKGWYYIVVGFPSILRLKLGLRVPFRRMYRNIIVKILICLRLSIVQFSQSANNYLNGRFIGFIIFL